MFLSLFPQTQHNSESFKTFFSLSLFLLQNSRKGRYLMTYAPYGFQSSNISGANHEYVRFTQLRLATITINFDTKEFVLETESPGEPKQLYKVDLIDLHKHWPLRVGICGHHTTTIEMVCFFISSKVIPTIIWNDEISFWFWFYDSWKQFIFRKWTSFVQSSQQRGVNELEWKRKTTNTTTMKWGTQFYFSQNEELEKCIQIFPIIKSMLIIIFDIFLFYPFQTSPLFHKFKERERREREDIEVAFTPVKPHYFFSFSQWSNKFERKLFFSSFWVFFGLFRFCFSFPLSGEPNYFCFSFLSFFLVLFLKGEKEMALEKIEDKKQKWEQVCEAAGIDFSLTNPGSFSLWHWTHDLSLSFLMNFWSPKGWSTHSKMMNKKHWK